MHAVLPGMTPRVGRSGRGGLPFACAADGHLDADTSMCKPSPTCSADLTSPSELACASSWRASSSAWPLQYAAACCCCSSASEKAAACWVTCNAAASARAACSARATCSACSCRWRSAIATDWSASVACCWCCAEAAAAPAAAAARPRWSCSSRAATWVVSCCTCCCCKSCAAAAEAAAAADASACRAISRSAAAAAAASRACRDAQWARSWRRDSASWRLLAPVSSSCRRSSCTSAMRALPAGWGGAARAVYMCGTRGHGRIASFNLHC